MSSNGTGTIESLADLVAIDMNFPGFESYESLLARAEDGASDRARALAAGIRRMLADLAEAVYEDEARAAKLARIGQLRAEAARLEAELGIEPEPAASAADDTDAQAAADEVDAILDGDDLEESDDAAESAQSDSGYMARVRQQRAERDRLLRLAHSTDVKVWAREAGHLVSERGRVANAVVQAYLAAQEATTKASNSAEAGEPLPDAAAVREWARANGYTVADRGRLGEPIYRAYAEAQGA